MSTAAVAGIPDSFERPRSLASYAAETGLRSLVVGVSRDPNAKVTVLLVEPTTSRPVLAVKAPTTDLAARAVERERRVLQGIHRMVPERLAQTVPRVVDTVDFEGRTALVVTAVAGTPLSVAYLGRRRSSMPVGVDGDFAGMETWLAAFQRATAGGSGALDLATGLDARLRRRFGDEPLVDESAECVAAIDDRLRRHSVVLTAVHGDLWFGNVLRTDGRVTGVVDWESAALSGNGARDLVRFADVHALYLARGGVRRLGRGAHVWGGALETALNSTGWFPDAFRRFLCGGLERLGASPASWRDSALAGVADLAATTDDDGFARRNLELFRRLAGRPMRKEQR